MNSYDLQTNFSITTSPTVISKIKISIISLELFTSVTLSVDLYDSNSNIKDNKIIVISGDDYKNWGNDDNSIITLVTNKLYENLQNNNTTLSFF